MLQATSFNAFLLLRESKIQISPLSIFENPIIHFINVDFPEPFGPTNATISPASMSRFISFKILFLFKCLILSASIIIHV